MATVTPFGSESRNMSLGLLTQNQMPHQPRVTYKPVINPVVHCCLKVCVLFSI